MVVRGEVELLREQVEQLTSRLEYMEYRAEVRPGSHKRWSISDAVTITFILWLLMLVLHWSRKLVWMLFVPTAAIHNDTEGWEEAFLNMHQFDVSTAF